MATRKKSAADQLGRVQEEWGKASVKLEDAADKAKDKARDVERAVRHGAEGIADEIEAQTGIPAKKSRPLLIGLAWAAVAAVLFGAAQFLF